MHCFAAMIHAVNRAVRDAAAAATLLDATRRSRGPRIPVGRPSSFLAHRDPRGRFEFHCPSEWDVRIEEGVTAVSTRLGTFARVDVLPAGVDVWGELKREMVAAGGDLTLDARQPRSADHARGKVTLGESRYALNGYRHRVGEESVVLSLGNVIDGRRGQGVERYEDRILEAVRREFRILPL